jgi:hypothetical protein
VFELGAVALLEFVLLAGIQSCVTDGYLQNLLQLLHVLQIYYYLCVLLLQG